MNGPNPDQLAIRRFIAAGRQPIDIDANPMARALGMRLIEVDEAAGRLVLSFLPGDQFIQGTGVLQGGAIAGMLDFAMAFVTLAVLDEGRSCASVSLNTAFMRPAPPGRYRATAQVERRGRAMAFTRAELAPEARPDAPVATATSVLAIVTAE